MQTILGSGGAIGTDLAASLHSYTQNIRLVSRNPQKVNASDQLFPADLTDSAQVIKAIEGSEVCYVTIGFEYSTKVWKKYWLPFMLDVVEACQQQQCKLVFFDNVYALSRESINHITEASPIGASSEKGQVRAAIDLLLLSKMHQGVLNIIIARAPDFFGPVKSKTV